MVQNQQLMTSLADLARVHSTLDRDDIDHLNRLTAEWAFLADLCFADLLLYVRAAGGKWLIVDQVRPATNQTMYPTDYIGSWADGDEAVLIERAASTGERLEGAIEFDGRGEDNNHARMLAIPVRRDGELIAVLSKEWRVRAGRPLGELERNYSFVFEEFAQMIEVGTFPFAGRVADSSAAPRVGDGVLTLDSTGTVTYVSPNANSALHRVGIQANPVGMRLAELGFHDGPVRQAFERREPIVEEFEQGSDVTLLCRCVPLISVDRDRHRGHRRTAAGPRCHRTPQTGPPAAQQGRHDPRDPPSGQEQPPDHLVAAATPGPSPHEPRGQGGGAGVGTTDPDHCTGPRVALAGTGRGHRVHRDRAATAAPRRGESAVSRSPGAVHRQR